LDDEAADRQILKGRTLMDPAYITPFISSIQNVFSTMLQLPVNVNAPSIKESSTATYDVSGIIGMSGDVVGSVVLSFPRSTAVRLVQLFTGQEISPESPDFADAIGELTNMVSGNAKGQFTGKKKVQISTPSVVVGQGHTIGRPREVPCIVIPCTTDCGEMVVEIAIQEKVSAAVSPSEVATSAKV
jgi:chemotaxis protein CheX